jgi:uncharacterized protein (DUF58 family)
VSVNHSWVTLRLVAQVKALLLLVKKYFHVQPRYCLMIDDNIALHWIAPDSDGAKVFTRLAIANYLRSPLIYPITGFYPFQR